MSLVRLFCLVLAFLTPVELRAAPMGTNAKPKPPSLQMSMLDQMSLAVRLFFSF